jgi:alkanesulfonate monooxygenase SsuD/methylene tetrahydromethanopterin reductase-like flavin-dependent oxidoreductase (luciferase family)
LEFSIIFEAQVAYPTRENEQAVIRDGVAQAVLADELGFDRFWAVEHHSLEWYAHMSAPEVFLTYVAARTTRIRVGHGVVCLPFAMNHPIRVAERVAMLDILSGGRVDFGAGRGASQQEVGAFGIDQADTQPQMEEALHAIPKMWRDEPFSFEGELLKVPPRPIRPRPVQDPHPPMFLACTRPETVKLAGRFGLGALCVGFSGPDDVAVKRQMYDEAIAARRPEEVVGAFAVDHLSALCPTVVLDDRDEAFRIGHRGQRFFVESLEHWYGGGPPPNPAAYDGEDNRAALVASEEAAATTTFGHEQVKVQTGKRNPNQVYGDAREVIDQVERLEAAGADEVLMILQMGTIPNSVVMQSIDNIGRKVIPHFRKRPGRVFTTTASRAETR